MNLDLKGKVIVLTGGAGKVGSIGHTLFQTLLEEEAIPVVLDNSNRGFSYEQEAKDSGKEMQFFKTDVLKPDDVESAMERTLSFYGKIDAIINNVGVNDGVGLESTYEEFVQSLKLNLVSHWLVVKYALKALKESKGSIINIGSKVALTGQGGTSAYAASKGGVLALTREWAVDLINHNIRVNAVVIAECWTPGYQEWLDSVENGQDKLSSIRSKIPLEKRMTRPQEIANTVVFLISRKSSHTTGQFIHVDGGYVHLDRALLNQDEV